jgi:hypothetical protein
VQGVRREPDRPVHEGLLRRSRDRGEGGLSHGPCDRPAGRRAQTTHVTDRRCARRRARGPYGWLKALVLPLPHDAQDCRWPYEPRFPEMRRCMETLAPSEQSISTLSISERIR